MIELLGFKYVGCTFGVDPFVAFNCEITWHILGGWKTAPHAMYLSAMWIFISQQPNMIIVFYAFEDCFVASFYRSVILVLQRDTETFLYNSSSVVFGAVLFSWFPDETGNSWYPKLLNPVSELKISAQMDPKCLDHCSFNKFCDSGDFVGLVNTIVTIF